MGYRGGRGKLSVGVEEREWAWESKCICQRAKVGVGEGRWACKSVEEQSERGRGREAGEGVSGRGWEGERARPCMSVGGRTEA